MNMSKRALTGMRLLIWGFFPALAILAGVVTAADRPAVEPEATSQPAAKPGSAEIAKARVLLAGAIAPPPKLTDAKTKHIKELIVKLGDSVWKVRQAASAELLKSGPEILPLLTEVADHKDLEISDRVSVAIKAIQARVEDIGSDLRPAIDTLAVIQDKKLIDMLLKLLNHSSVSGRYTAEYALRRVTGKSFGFSAHDEPPARVRAAGRWRKWWKDSKAKFSYDQVGIKARSLVFLITNNGAKTVTAVTLQGKTVWSKVMRTGVNCATGTANGNIIVGYASGKTVEEYNQQGKAVWAAPNAPDRTSGVFDIARLSNGNTLIAYANNHCVVEIDAKGKTVWQTTALKCPTSAQRLANGNTLIADYSAKRVVEVDAKGKIVWQKTGLSNPADAVMLPNGNVLIGEAPNRVLEVNRAGKILWQRKCPARVTSICSLPDGTIAISNQAEGAILLGRDGKKIRQLLVLKGSSGMWSKIRLVPSTVLTYK
jgi:hypothetical protein